MDREKLSKWISENAEQLRLNAESEICNRFPGESFEIPNGEDEEDASLMSLRFVRRMALGMAVLNLKKSVPKEFILDMLLSIGGLLKFQIGIEVGRSHMARQGADARHAENRETAERIKAWYTENMALFSSLDAAAEAAARIEPVAFRTARKHVGEAAKYLRSARKA